MTPVVEASGVAKRFGATVALADGRLTVQPGETHALVGRNGAGKSTLVGVLTGLLRPDGGEVRFGGEPAPAPGDRAAWRRQVACVYQKPSVVPELSVAENLFLHRQPRGRFGLLSPRKLRAGAAGLLEEWAVHVDPDLPARELSVEQRQLVEIAGALSLGARFVILDEPTAQLEGRAITRLFDRLRTLREQGVTFLFISHHLPEIYEICQRVTVFRDARYVLDADVATLGRDELVAAMIGEARGLVDVGADRPTVSDDAEPALELVDVAGGAAARSSASPGRRPAGSGSSPRPWSGCGRAPAPCTSTGGGSGRTTCPPRCAPASATCPVTATPTGSSPGCRWPRTPP